MGRTPKKLMTTVFLCTQECYLSSSVRGYNICILIPKAFNERLLPLGELITVKGSSHFCGI